MKIVRYSTCAGPTLLDLDQMVNESIKKGWQPFGGLAAGEGGFSQAMVLYEAPPQQNYVDLDKVLRHATTPC